VHRFFSSIFGLFLSPVGVLVLALLDSTMLFFLPAAIDTAVIVMSARHSDWFWVYPILATCGSLAGAALTFAFGHKIGEAGLKKWIPERKLKTVRQKIDHGGVVAMGMTAVLPPPFPLTPFVLTSGAFDLDRRKFFLTVGAMRLLRFGTESILALVYGRRILRWLDSDIFEYVISGLMVLALAGTAVTIIRSVRKAK
jgi:membrane protein YqaA with SNARE-associated domain